MPGEIRSELQGRLLGGRYRLERALAAGGMAEVWQATDTVLNRRVAVKLLRPHLAADPAFVRRFRREALAAARLNHPAIVAIYDSCSEEGAEAIVMEFVEGQTLRQRLDAGTLDPHFTVGVGAQVAEALEVAHRAGLVHRDIKPANLLICSGDATVEGLAGVPRLMVTDFGIAKAFSATGGDDNGEDLTKLTQTGAIVGTAKYLAPEQVQGKPVDQRTDIYALGLVLYECLSGQPPFTGDTELATAIARLQSDPRPLRQLRPDVRRDLEGVVFKAMAREPDERFPTASALRAALLDADPGSSGSTGVVGGDPTDPAPGQLPSFVQSERSWILPTVAVGLVATLLIVAGVLIGRSSAGRDLVDRALVAVGARDDSGTSSQLARTIVQIVPESADAFDPEGDNRTENNHLAPNAVDGDPATAWRTECYLNPFTKHGVGLVVNLPATVELARLEVDTQAAGWTGVVYVSNAAGQSLADWGQPVANHNGPETQSTATFDLRGVTGRSVLLWITSLDGIPADDCFKSKPNSRRLEIAEARVFGFGPAQS